MFDPPPGNDDLASQVFGDEYTIAVGGETIAVKRPNARALHVFTTAISRHAPKESQNNMVALFVRDHMSETDYERLLARMIDPDETSVSLADLGRVMREIATLGTARPTGPLRT